MTNQTKNIAVFIDVENFPDFKSFDAFKVIDKLKEKGRIILKRAYADWGRFAANKRQMLENSIELIEMPSHSSKGKNSADIKLVVEALETALTKNHIDTFVVIAGDSDYTPLISKLRELDKYVIVIGHQKAMSDLLKGYCDEIYYYDNFIGVSEEKTVNTSKLTTAYSLLTRAIYNLQEQGSKTVGSRVKQQMRQLDSSYDESEYGFRSLKDFWHRAFNDKIITFEPIEHGDFAIQHYSSDALSVDIKPKEHNELFNLVYWSLMACQHFNATIDFNEYQNISGKSIRRSHYRSMVIQRQEDLRN